MDNTQQAEIAWRDGAPVSTQFDDPYFSLEDGLAETRHTFLAGNDLPARFKRGFHIAELGFGTGLNLLAALDLWVRADAPGRLYYTSFEAFPLSKPNLARALAAFPSVNSDWFVDAWPLDVIETDHVSLRVIIGDARHSLPAWNGIADAWFLDGFAPANNPEMWGADLMAAVAAHTAPGGSFATFTAAGHVRRALEEAGFAVERRPGFGRKRHMSVGRLR